MPRIKQNTKKPSNLNARLKSHYKAMGVNTRHPLFKALLPFSIEFKQYVDNSRVDKRGLKWILFAYLKHVQRSEQSLDGFLSQPLQEKINDLKPKRGSTAGMLAKLSRRKERADYLVQATPATAIRFERRVAERANLGQSTYTMDALTPSHPMEPASDIPFNRTPLLQRGDDLYQRELSAPSFQLYRKVPPPIMEPVSVPIPSDSLDTLKKTHPDLFESKPDTFSFTITKEGILSREGVPRPVSQGKVVGLSASEIFKKFGLISINTPWGTHYHLAHRQGWMLGGSQSRINLDAATAGSNYHTLFFIESPAKSLVLEEDVAINVKGQVCYHDTLPIPIKITYKLKWGNGREIQKSIYPLDPESPKQGSSALSEAAFFSVRTPKRKAEEEPDDIPEKKAHRFDTK